MSSRAGKILFGFILHLLVGTLIADDDHICKRIMAGQFDKIKINSITVDAFKAKDDPMYQELRIYESYNRMYRAAMDSEVRDNSINMENVRRDTYDVGGGADTSGYSQKYFAQSFAGVDENVHSLKAVYHFQVKNYLITKHAFLFSSPNGYKMYQYKIWFWPDGIAWQQPANFYPNEMAIAHNQKGNSVTMYAIHRDLYDGTNDFIIYQFWIHNWGLTLDTLEQVSSDVKSKAEAWFWYLEKTSDPLNVKLASRKINSHNRNPAHQLFSTQPVGFLHRTNDQLYLFDQSLGCVYRLSNWSQESLSVERMAEGKDLYFKRENIPYERYFQCNSGMYPKAAGFDQKHRPDRCNTNISSANPGVPANVNPQTQPPFVPRAEEKELPIEWICAGAGALILVLLIAGVLLMTKGKKDSIGKDNSKASSIANSEASVSATSSHKRMDSSKAASTPTSKVSGHGKMASTSKGNLSATKSRSKASKTTTPSSAKKVRPASKR